MRLAYSSYGYLLLILFATGNRVFPKACRFLKHSARYACTDIVRLRGGLLSVVHNGIRSREWFGRGRHSKNLLHPASSYFSEPPIAISGASRYPSSFSLSNEPVANIRSLFAEILQWAITTLPSLFQTTSFGLTGLVIIDMLSKLKVPRPQVVDLIFFDTLHHFPETLALIDRVRKRYHHINIHVYRPEGIETAEAFARKHGENLWETNDTLYDWIAKVEPAQRAYRELQVYAILTGRRRSQGGKRGDLRVLDVDEAGLIKINPLANWTFQQVWDYVKDNNVPYNELLDRGYKSVGDSHSTKPITDGEDERAGRWQGKSKTECGIHDPRSKFAQFLNKNKK